MKRIKLIFILILVGMLLIGCKSKETRVQEQLDLGSKYMAELDYESAIVALNKAIKIDPKNVDAYKMLAEVYEKSGRLDDARATLEKVLELDDLSYENKDEINDRIKNLDFLVAISKLPGEYDEPTALELSNIGSNDIYYSIDTKDSRLVATDVKYTSPILLDEDGSYIVKAYTVDSSGNKYSSTEVKYTIKLSKEHSEKDSWESIGNVYRYRGKDGKIVTGWQQIDGSWYYFKDNGDMATGVANINGTKYCFDEDGVMLTGWQQINGKWYYISDSGELSTGWKEIDGKWYYFADNGEMKTDQYIDGYYVGADGVRTNIVKEPVPPSKQYTDKFRYGSYRVYYEDNQNDSDDWLGYIYDDMLATTIVSEGPIIDRGSYFEVQNTTFMGFRHSYYYDEDLYEMFKTIVYVRKDAIGTLYYITKENEGFSTMTKTAEQCFRDCGGRLVNVKGNTDYVLNTFIKDLNECIDKEGYIIKFDDLLMHAA